MINYTPKFNKLCSKFIHPLQVNKIIIIIPSFLKVEGYKYHRNTACLMYKYVSEV